MPSSSHKRQQQYVDPRRVDVGQFGQIADAHQHFGIGKTLSHGIIPGQAFGKSVTDRLQHGIDPQPHVRRRPGIRPSR